MTIQRLVIANFRTGLETDLTAFNINNDAFPVLTNAYVWRGRVLRKRGIQFLGRLQRDLENVSLGTSLTSPWSFNIYTTAIPPIINEPDAQIIPGSLVIDFANGLGFLDQGDGTLAQYGLISNAMQTNPCQITSNNHNLVTGAQVTISGVQGMTELNDNTYTITVVDANNFTLDGIDATGFNAYTAGGIWISTTAGNTGIINYSTGDVTLIHTAGAGIAVTINFGYYPALPVMGLEDFNVGNRPQPIMISFDTRYSYGFNQGTNEFYDVNFYKTTMTPFVWNGENYQQFWTTNYLGITPILNTNSATGCLWATNGNPGFHFQNIATITNANPTVISTAVPHNLVNNDWVWFNENSSADGIANLNGRSFQVTVLTPTTFSIPLDSSALAINNTGIFQTLTSSGITPDQDGIRWYDGDPTSAAPPNNPGWVNFAPPLSEYDPMRNPNPQYLIGCKVIIPFKNRLLCGGVYLATSVSVPQFIPNRFVYSQVGTPFYTNPLPIDIASQTPDVAAWYQVAGRGGFIGAPIDDQIITVGENEDVLITVFETQPLKLIFTSNDTLPFIFQTISAELGGISTFAAVKLDTGILGVGYYGFTLTTSTSVQRIDLQIPDEVFDIAQANNKALRITGIRDYQKEFVFFTYCPSNRNQDTFNTKTLVYNYRENNWAQFEETFTTYGTFRRITNRTWANIGQIYGTWSNWTDPWDFGLANAFAPVIVGGNQQGFVMQRSFGTSEQPSKFIQAITNNLVTSPDHGLHSGDFIEISGMIGSTNLNGTIQEVTVQSPDTFTINDPAIGAYLGGGVYTMLSRPFFQTKQFPIFWSDGRQVRIGTTRLLLEENSVPSAGISPPQITVNIYASQNSKTPSNDPVVQPYFAFSNIVLTCPEIDTTFGAAQSQIWHRLSTSINGDTIQLGFTLSNVQMRDKNINQKEIILHAISIDLYKGPILI